MVILQHEKAVLNRTLKRGEKGFLQAWVYRERAGSRRAKIEHCNQKWVI